MFTAYATKLMVRDTGRFMSMDFDGLESVQWNASIHTMMLISRAPESVRRLHIIGAHSTVGLQKQQIIYMIITCRSVFRNDLVMSAFQARFLTWLYMESVMLFLHHFRKAAMKESTNS